MAFQLIASENYRKMGNSGPKTDTFIMLNPYLEQVTSDDLNNLGRTQNSTEGHSALQVIYTQVN